MCLIKDRAELCRNGPDLRMPAISAHRGIYFKFNKMFFMFENGSVDPKWLGLE